MTRKFVLKGMLPVCAALALLAACGDDDSSSVYGGSTSKTEKVEKFKNLDECTKSLEGDTVYVEDKDADYVCDDGEWVKVDDEEESSSSKGSKSSSSSKGESSSSKGGDVSSDSKDESSSSLSDVEKALGICDSTMADSLGKIEKKTYFCKDGKWSVVGGMEEVVGVCRKAIYDSIATTSGKNYICGENGWESISALEAEIGRCTEANADTVAKSGKDYYRCVASMGKWVRAERADHYVGKCTESIRDTVVKVQVEGDDYVYYACYGEPGKEHFWMELAGINQADIYNLPKGKDGDSHWGLFDSSACYVYDTEYEKDYGQAWTYHPKDSLSCMEGLTGCTVLRADTLVKNSKNGKWYRCHEGSGGSPYWSVASDNDLVLGVCKKSIADSVIKHGSDYFVCRYKEYPEVYEWEKASLLEYDTYRWKAGKVGDTARGNVTEELYYYGENGWTYLTRWSWDVPLDLRWNKTVTYGTLKDTRDNKEYRTVEIGDQTWMAENLNYAIPGKSWCYRDSSKYCGVGGRFYTWAAAIDSTALANDKENPMTCGYGVHCELTGKVRGVCPKGWHLPSMEEWSLLSGNVDGLRSETGWKGIGDLENGSNETGFTALPTGARLNNIELSSIGGYGGVANYWSSSYCEGAGCSDTLARCASVQKDLIIGSLEKFHAASVRCVKD